MLRKRPWEVRVPAEKMEAVSGGFHRVCGWPSVNGGGILCSRRGRAEAGLALPLARWGDSLGSDGLRIAYAGTSWVLDEDRRGDDDWLGDGSWGRQGRGRCDWDETEGKTAEPPP